LFVAEGRNLEAVDEAEGAITGDAEQRGPERLEVRDVEAA
jgi:hypothetical protein